MPTPADWLSAVRLALRGAPTGGELVISATDERTVIDLRSPDGTQCSATIRRRVPVMADARQLALPIAPALPEALVELVAIDRWEPTPPVEAIHSGTAVLWTGVTAFGPWRTVVSAATADILDAFAAGCFERREPSAPSHVLRVGSRVMTPGGERAVLGLVASDGDDGCGAVLDVDGTPRVAWLDSARIAGDRVSLSPSERYRGVPGDDGWWTAQHHQAPAPIAEDVPPKATKRARKKAGAA